MAVRCGGDVGVEAVPERCFAVTADVESWPQWVRELERVEVLDRGSDGWPSRARMVADVFGQEFDATVAFVHAAPDTVRFSLVEAPKLTGLEGSFRFEPAGGGSRMYYALELVLVKPKAARIERMVSRKIGTALCRDLRRHIERSGRR
ncbi:MAG TPA: SRPBCC family protein [Acidimicrobiia bacterium]|nr:SRPBCC family protein [Acidimicrobiia bacterium]